ncbi:MAG: HYR domain-containing protein [Planctomycetota bacterium]|nr:HYR domain-containing protein [Planctomycetota bacterium]
MSHESIARMGILQRISVIRWWSLVAVMAMGIVNVAPGQCVIDAEPMGSSLVDTHVEMDGNWVAISDGITIEMLNRDTGVWLTHQSIDLLGATLGSISLEGNDLVVGLEGEVQFHSFDGISWNQTSFISGVGVGLLDPTWGSVLDHSGDLSIVGAATTDEVYFYTRVFDGTGASSWISSGTVTGALGSGFGTSVALSGSLASVTAPAASEVLTYQYQGIATNQWLLDGTHPLAIGSGTSISLDQSAGQARLLLPSGLGANVFLRGATGWAPESSLIFTASTDATLELFGEHALVTTDCGLRLFARSATGWNSGFNIQTVDALNSCMVVPGGSIAQPMTLSGSSAMFASQSGTHFLGSLTFTDCNNNGVLDSCDLAVGIPDCDGNGIPDSCDFSTGLVDCNNNSILDPCEIAQGFALDCNSNGVPDSCDMATGGQDCNGNNLVDGCEIEAGDLADCNLNGIPDSCDALAGVLFDTTPPLIEGMPADITISIGSGQCESAASWISPTASDTCSLTNLSSSHNSGDLFSSGVTTVIYTATDEVGNVAELSFLVSVIEPDAPFFISVPGTINVASDPVNCSTAVNWSPPFALDTNGCSFPAITSDFQPGDAFQLGATTVTVIATDGSGNTAEASFIVNVIDISGPTIEQLPDMVVSTQPTTCLGAAFWAEPLVTDCSSFTLISTTPSPALVSFAGRTVTYSALDSAGNTSQMSFSIALIDDIPPTITGMPGNMTLLPALGTCGASLDWVLPVATDGCGVVGLVSTFEPPATFGVGSTTVTYTATDTRGNETIESFTVVVLDNDFPVFTSAPGTTEVITSETECDAAVTWVEPVAVDCTSVTMTSSHVSGSIFPIGVHQVTYTATDQLGKATTIAFAVSVVDGTAPILVGAPADMTIHTNPTECTAIATWPSPTASDSCSPATLTTNVEPGTALPVGVTAVTYTVTDEALNSILHTFFVTVVDAAAPEFDITMADVQSGTSLGICSAQVFWIEPVISDDCSVPSVVKSHPSGAFFDLGTTTVTYTATDGGGNSSSQSFAVTVTDTEAPGFFQMPADQIQVCLPGNCSAAVTWAHPLVLDHCEAVIFQVSHNPGDLFPLGDTVVTYTSSDSLLNQASQSFTVTVVDQEVPFFTSALPDIVLPIDAGLCAAFATWVDPTAEDLCGVVTLGSNHPSGTLFSTGTTPVIYTCTDESGNTSTLSFNVTVDDIESPQILTMPLSFAIGVVADSCTGIPTWTEPTVQDCDSATLISTHDSGAALPLGDTLVTYTATDLTGNQVSAAFTVTVTDGVSPQLISVPANLIAATQPGSCDAGVSWQEAIAVDHCSSVAISYDPPQGSIFQRGISVVTVTAIDAAFNSSSATFTVEILDQENPIQVAGPPAQVILANPTGACQVAGAWEIPAFADNCTTNLTVTSTHQLGDLLPIGETLVSYTCQDEALNQVVSSFSVLVVDTTPPSIDSMPLDVEVVTVLDSCEAVATWGLPQASDCSEFTMESDLASGATLGIGIHIVNFNFTDVHGNVASDSILVRILDGGNPLIHGALPEITIETGAGSCAVTAIWPEPTTTDCTASALESNYSSGSAFQVGTTTVVYTAIDSAGNQSSTSFDVTVLDATPPVIVTMPPGMTLSAPLGACQVVATWAEPEATDCVSSLFSSDFPSGSLFPIGTTPVTYTATDPVGNSSSASFTVTVLDVEAPQIDTIPASLTVDSTPGSCTGLASWEPATASDCSTISSIEPNHASGSAFSLGTTTVTYTATDVHGNSSSASFQVTVLDAEVPTITDVPASIVVDNLAGLCSAQATWLEPNFNDCSDALLTSDLPSGSSFPVGTTLVTYTAVDSSGNSSQASFEVLVVDVEAPFFVNVAAQLTFPTSPGQCVGVAIWDPAQAGDFCGIATATSSHPPGTEFPMGDSQVIHTATDESGNSSTMITQITIVDAEAPIMSGMPLDIILNAPTGQCESPVTWVAPSTTDCTAVTLVGSETPGALFPIGVQSVTYTAIDQQGNIAEQSFTITVLDVDGPTIADLPLDLLLSTDPGICGATASWIEATASDCSDLESLVSSTTNGSILAPGLTVVIYTATDVHGNSSQASFDIEVVDATGPVITELQQLVTINSSLGQCGASVFWPEPTVVDECGVDSIQSSAAVGSFFPVGESVVTYTAIDFNGNSTSAEMVVVVSDVESPQMVIFPDSIVVNPSPSTCTAAVIWAMIEAIDNCSDVIINTSLPSGAEFSVGVTEVLVTATDAAGNTTTNTFTVTVEECTSDFVRGDANDDGTVDITDAVVTIGYIFQGLQFTCLDALDDNDDGVVDISDAIYHFGVLFTGGPPPPPPFDQCGVDPTEDSLICELYQNCP